MKYKINKKSNGPLYITEEDEIKLNHRYKDIINRIHSGQEITAKEYAYVKLFSNV